ncbi:MAG TPA: adenylate/guanylate cyclase domain-containing protein [Candidatus Binatia bacterium]|nr:adenylate/guanylate cyclase domain-containing protein [Candidatus Binatia bacterium]
MANQAVERRLAAIMAADVVSYSRLMGTDEVGTLNRLKAHRRELIDPAIAGHRGRIVKTTGDGMLVEFASVVDAVACAVAVQRGMLSRNTDIPEDKRVIFRIGINVGDIIIDGDDIFGDGVNIAARLETLCEPGGLCISRTVHEQVRDKLALSFADLGEQTVKNISRAVGVFGMSAKDIAALPEEELPHAPATAEPAAEIAPPPHRRKIILSAAAILILIVASGAWFVRQRGWGLGGNVALTARHSIVVLPFTNLSADPEQAYLADGLTTKITTDLSRAAGLFVIAATTANTFKDKQITVQQVGKDLGVRYALQDNVQRGGEKIRINAQLADVSSGGQLWAETFDGDRSDLFVLQDRITSRIANSIGREIVVAAARESEARKTDPKASDLMLHAVALTTKTPTLENLQQREKLFRELLLVDPNSVDAMAQLATCLVNQGRRFTNLLGPQVAEEKLKEGYSIALKAKELDPANALTYEALGYYFIYRRELSQAIAALQKGMALNRNHNPFYTGLALASTISGEPKKTIGYAEQAISFDPRGPQTAGSMNQLGVGHFYLGHDDLAIEWLEKAHAEDPKGLVTISNLAVAYAKKGNMAKAKSTAAELLRIAPNFRLSNEGLYPFPSSPEAYKKLWREVYMPAANKAGLPE